MKIYYRRRIRLFSLLPLHEWFKFALCFLCRRYTGSKSPHKPVKCVWEVSALWTVWMMPPVAGSTFGTWAFSKDLIQLLIPPLLCHNYRNHQYYKKHNTTSSGITDREARVKLGCICSSSTRVAFESLLQPPVVRTPLWFTCFSQCRYWICILGPLLWINKTVIF